MIFSPGSIVVAYLHEPKEQLWGVLKSIEPTGFVISGIPLPTFDDWLHEVSQGTTHGMGFSTLFFPLHRMEKLLLDEPLEGVPSLHDRFSSRMGISLLEYLARSADDSKS